MLGPYLRIFRKYGPQIVILILLFILATLFLLSILFKKERVHKTDNKVQRLEDCREQLKKEGYCVLKNVLGDREIMYLRELCKKEEYQKIQQYLLNNEVMKRSIYVCAGSPYQFQDYIWIIKKSAVHTCHRDNNGDFFNAGQKWPSYTMLVYLEDMEKCLGVIPESHREPGSHFVNFNDSLKELLCGRGDIILFNANLIHVGTITDKQDNLRIQLKVTHKDDIQYINYYENFHKVLNRDNNLPSYLRKIQRSLSCTFPGISNMTQQENIRTSRGSDNGAIIRSGQKWFSYLFYGNSDFYDLPNAY